MKKQNKHLKNKDTENKKNKNYDKKIIRRTIPSPTGPPTENELDPDLMSIESLSTDHPLSDEEQKYDNPERILNN